MRSFLSGLCLFCTVSIFAQVDLVKDIYPGGQSSYANADYFCGNGLFFFNAKDSTHGYQLWRSNGNESGTYLLKEFYQSPNNTLISGFGSLNNEVFIIVGSTKKLWKSDGTPSGTVVVKNFDSSNFYDVPSFYQLGAYLYFNGAEDSHGQELWRTDGTTAGTVLIKDIFPLGNHSRPGNFTSFNGQLYFTARTQNEGFELWKSDGTTQGTVMVKDINPGPSSSSIRNIVSTPIGMFFQADNGTNGTELWISDGSDAGTHLVKDLNPNGNGFNSNQGVKIHAYTNGKVIFNGFTPSTGNELFVTDGTESGTQLLIEFGPGSASGLTFNQFFTFGDKAIFVGTDNQAGYEPWISDGTISGTALLKDINPGSSPSNPSDYLVHQNKLYFAANQDLTGRELWVSDGTEAGTALVADIAAGASSSSIDHLASCGNLLFFYADNGTNGSELYRLGTPSTNTVSLEGGESSLLIYPNPSKNWIQLDAGDLNLQGALLEILSLDGQKVKARVISEPYEKVNISELNSGIYFLRLRVGDKLLCKKLIVNR